MLAAKPRAKPAKILGCSEFRRCAAVIVGVVLVVAASVSAVQPQSAEAQTAERLCLDDSAAVEQFADVRAEYYGSGHILCARALGLTEGIGSGNFGAGGVLTRGQMASFLTRLWRDVLGHDCPAAPVHSFTDVADSVHAENIACLFALDVAKGRSTSRYEPAGQLTSAQVTLFTARLLNKAKRSACKELASVGKPDELAVAADCLKAIRVAPDDSEATSGTNATRSQMAVYLVGAWHKATGRGNPPRPPAYPGRAPTLVRVEVADRRPVVGAEVSVIADVTDGAGAAVVGAKLELRVDGVKRMNAVSDKKGRAVFAYEGPSGSANEGGYDSLQVRVQSTEALSSPVGLFWQQPRSRWLSLSVSPDKPHSSAKRTFIATLFKGDRPLAGQSVRLRIDGEEVAKKRTGKNGVARFTRSKAFHGPFDLATVELVADPDVVSGEVLISWPMKARGGHSGNDWELVWSDEFNGDVLDRSKWTPSNNCPPIYPACETDRVENIELADGRLYLRSLREPYSGINNWKGSGDQFGPSAEYTPGRFQTKDFTAARIETKRTQSFTYGRFEMLGKLPRGHGTFYAWWMRPENSPYGSGSSAGEIDIAEGANIGTGRVDAQLPGPGWGVHHVVHMGYPFANPFSLTNLPVDPSKSYHLYSAEWDTASIRFYVDGRRVLTVPQSDWFSHPKGEQRVSNEYAPFDVPFNLVINNTVGNWATESLPDRKVPDSTVFPAEFVVDYVRVYECRSSSGGDAGPGQGCETP